MHLLLFLFYSLLLGYAITRMRFFRNSGIRPPVLLLLFGIHVCMGCLENWIAWRYFPSHGDVWSLLQTSEVSRRELATGLDAFLATNSGWVDMPHNVLRIVVVILNMLSGHDLSIDTLLFSFPVFMGSFALFRSFSGFFPENPLAALSALLFPSTLFWTSCLYTEGLVYALTGWLLYILYTRSVAGRNVQKRQGGPVSAGRQLRTLVSCFLLFMVISFFRTSTLVTLLPALAVGALAAGGWLSRWQGAMKTAWIIPAVALVFVLFLAFSGVGDKLAGILEGKQAEFQRLEGSSRLYLPVLDGTRQRFLETLPWAIRNGLFEPLPGSGGKSLYLVFSLELLILWAVAGAAVFRTALAGFRINRFRVNDGVSDKGAISPFAAYCLVYALCGMVLVGLIVPFAGAIVRYRSIYLPFLLAPCLHSLRLTKPLKKINATLNKYIYSSNL